MDDINIYCDENCHIENDHQKAMVIGALRCPKANAREIAENIRDIKQKHGIRRFAEIKWKKVSKSKQDFYIDIINYFFDCDKLLFRAVVFPNKDKCKLDHEKYHQTHDDWYYKMFYTMLEPILLHDYQYNIYIDKKQSYSSNKINKLKTCLSSNYNIAGVQNVLSHQVEQIQLADLLIGAISYLNRDFLEKENPNVAKVALVRLIQKRSGLSLTRKTEIKEKKINILTWETDYYG